MRAALIVGLAGERLTPGEHTFLAQARPAGVILFARNSRDPRQVSRLIADSRAAIAADDILVLIDQEGGRVRRLRPPHWRELPSAAAFAAIHAADPVRGRRLAHLAARLTAADLRAIGVNTNCAPVLDLAVPGAHDIIGDRAYGSAPADIAALGRAVAEGYIAGGVVPVIKHIPGHGRALADSHSELPVVDAALAVLEATDFAPFRALADMPAAMTAHVVYSAIDPHQPASASAKVTAAVIRGSIGFQGLLLSDDLGMKALSGSYRERAEAVLRAGSDVALHCSGALHEMEDAAAGSASLAGQALARFEQALAVTRDMLPYDAAEAEAALAEVIGRSS